MTNGYTYPGQIALIGGLDYQGGPFSPQVAESDFDINMPSGDTLQDGSLFINIQVTPTFLQGAVATVILNGNFIGNMNFDPFTGGQSKILNQDVFKYLKNTGNKLSIKLDPFSNSMTFTVQATLFYTYLEPVSPYQNTTPITQPAPIVNNPTTGNQANGTPQGSTWEKVKPYVIGGMVLVGVGLVAYALVGTKSGRGMTINLINRARRKS